MKGMRLCNADTERSGSHVIEASILKLWNWQWKAKYFKPTLIGADRQSPCMTYSLLFLYCAELDFILDQKKMHMTNIYFINRTRQLLPPN